MRLTKTAFLGLLLTSVSHVAMAQSGCTGQLAGGTLCGNPTASKALPSITATPVLGIPGSVQGTISLSGVSSGQPKIAPQAAAGTATLTLPTTSGTFPSSASSPLTIDAVTGLLTCTTCLTTTSSFANPTAFVGFSTINGSAITAMRSDAAPALSTAVYSTAAVGTTLLQRDGSANAFANNFVGKSILLLGSSSGTATIVPQSAAGTPTLTLPSSSGTFAVTASAPLALSATTGNLSITGVANQVLAGATPAFTATPTLGTNGGTGGQITFNGSTSGSVALRVPAAAGTSTVFQLPSSNGTAGFSLITDGLGQLSYTASGSGTVTSVNCTSGLAGGVITSSGTCTLDGATLASQVKFTVITATGTSTFTPLATTKRIEFGINGAGGGGGGGGTGAGAGGNGGSTTLGIHSGTTLATAGGGSGASSGGTSGGAGGTSSGTACTKAQPGGAGSGIGTGAGNTPGGIGGASPTIGVSGVGGADGGNTPAAPGANTGAGGGGGSTSISTTIGGGGGGGGFCGGMITTSIASSYDVILGIGGTAGTAGTSGAAGAVGGSGYAWLLEYPY